MKNVMPLVLCIQMVVLLQVNVVSIGQHLPLTFVLSSYEATKWVIKVSKDVTVAHVFLVREITYCS